MSKTQKGGKATQNAKHQKSKKMPEVEDFFTVFLQKKNRNLNKKLKHISELEDELKQKGGDKSTFTPEQCVLLAKRPEVQQHIADNEGIRSIYLEAYSKREDLPVPESKKSAPEVNVAEIKEQAMRHTVACVSKLMMASYLCRNKESCAKFCSQSGVSGVDSVFELNRCCFEAEGKDNNERFAALQEMLVNWVEGTPVLSPANRPMCDMVSLVNDMFASDKFAGFAPEQPAPVVIEVEVPVEKLVTVEKTVEKVVEVEQTQEESAPAQPRKDTNNDMFMQEDDDDSENMDGEDEVEAPSPAKAPVTNPKSPAKPKKDQQKEEPKKSGGDSDDEDEWQQVNTKKRDPNDFRGRGGRGGRGRGNRGGRGFYKDGKPREPREGQEGQEGQAKEGGRKIERKDWKPRGDGEERKEWKPRGDGEERREWKPRGDGEERREWKPRGDGEGRGRGGRGRGGRGRGGRGRGGEPREGNERPPQGEQGLKEIGVSEQPVPQGPPAEAE